MILAFIAAAVGFSGIKVGLINGKAFLYTVVYQVLELATAGTAGIVTFMQTLIVGHLPVGIP